MRAALASQVKRVVLTSSMAAIMNGLDMEKTHHTPDCWAEDTECDPMQKSKLLCEKYAWNFIENLPEN